MKDRRVSQPGLPLEDHGGHKFRPSIPGTLAGTPCGMPTCWSQGSDKGTPCYVPNEKIGSRLWPLAKKLVTATPHTTAIRGAVGYAGQDAAMVACMQRCQARGVEKGCIAGVHVVPQSGSHFLFFFCPFGLA